MSEVLYLPTVNPPERVLHHALLYRDGIATLAPDDPLAYLDERVRCAHEAGLYRPLPTGSLWRRRQLFPAVITRAQAVDRHEVRELVLRGEFEPRWGQTYDNWANQKDPIVFWDSRALSAGDPATILVDNSTVRVGVVQSAWSGGCDPGGFDFYPVTCSGSGTWTTSTAG